jgi:hypothetical protein
MAQGWRKRVGRKASHRGQGHPAACTVLAILASALVGCGLSAFGPGGDVGFVGSGGGGGVFLDSGSDGSASPESGSAEAGSRDVEVADVGVPDVGSTASGTPDGGDAGREPNDAGSDVIAPMGAAFVDAGVSFEGPGELLKCPGISVFSISPAALGPGQKAQLDVASEGPPATVEWSVSPIKAGQISNPNALTPTFECAGVGAVTVTATIGRADGAPCAGVPFTALSGSIDCRAR